jgi:hypothetical protein
MMTGRATDQQAADAVLAAFEAGRDARRPAIECYQMAVRKWREYVSDDSAKEAARHVINIVLAARPVCQRQPIAARASRRG